MARDGVPELPQDDLSETIQRAWTNFWTSEISGLVLDADRPALHRLFEMYDQRERLMRAYRSKPFTKGSTNQTVVHPAAKEIASVDSRIQSLEDRFGITPAGRLKLGIILGAAAKSLEEMNRDFDTYDEENDIDPRLGKNVIDLTG